jgi:hypothetical protein
LKEAVLYFLDVIMLIRNGTYTLFQGIQFELSINSDDSYSLLYRGTTSPLRNGVRFLGLDNEGLQVYKLENYKIEEIYNSFEVRTYAIWKGQIFDTDRFENGRFRIWSDNRDIAHQGKMETFERGIYMKWIPRTEIIRVWENRTKSRYSNLPFPDQVSKIEAIDFFT